ncbi:hypothetical protein D3C72_2496960 [compost metagenome]
MRTDGREGMIVLIFIAEDGDFTQSITQHAPFTGSHFFGQEFASDVQVFFVRSNTVETFF